MTCISEFASCRPCRLGLEDCRAKAPVTSEGKKAVSWEEEKWQNQTETPSRICRDQLKFFKPLLIVFWLSAEPRQSPFGTL